MAGAGAGLVVSIDPVELGGEAVPGLKYEPVAFGHVFVASPATSGAFGQGACDHSLRRKDSRPGRLQLAAASDGQMRGRARSGGALREHVFSRSHKKSPRRPMASGTPLPKQVMHLLTATSRPPTAFDILDSRDVIVRW